MYGRSGGEAENGGDEGEGLLPAAAGLANHVATEVNQPSSRYDQVQHQQHYNNHQQQHFDFLAGGGKEPAEKGGGGLSQPHHLHPRHPMMEPKAKRRRRWNCFAGNKFDNARTASSSVPPIRRPQPRLVDKNGECIIRPNNLRGSFGICFRNWFHLVIEHSWRRIFLLFAGSFMASWFSFGLLYFLIQQYSGDLQNLSEQHQCIANVHSLTSAFLFSLESQHTIGYGSRYMTEVCPLAYATLSLQCIVGVLLQTILAGIVIAKILRPKKRKQEMRFSQCAVIGPVDDEDQRPALMIRLADIQHRLYIAESHVRLYMATTKINKRGECELIGVQDMNVGYDTGMDRVLLLWPVVIRHIIDQDSPLWEITEEKLKSCQFELIMTVEGIVEATGMAFQARTSFLPDEILWAQRFVPLISLNQRTNHFEVDYDLFDVTESHPLELWLPPEEDDHDVAEECTVPATKLSVISELDPCCNNGAIGGHLPNGIILPHPAAQQESTALMAAPTHHQGQFRRKSTCSIAESIKSGHRFHAGSPLADDVVADSRAAARKTSRSSLLHVLLRRTQTSDSSPLVSNNNICHGGEEGIGSPECLDGSALPPLPASPFVVHTLQHSGFT